MSTRQADTAGTWVVTNYGETLAQFGPVVVQTMGPTPVLFSDEVTEREEFVELLGSRLRTVTTGTGRPIVLCHGGPGG